jgi:hypothetical protein
MNSKNVFLFFLFTIFFIGISTAQNVSVNPLTGSPNVVIPIYTIKSGPLSMPMNLVYNSSGIKPLDVEGTAGMGWSFQTGGQITREVRGIPDDIIQDNADNTMVGWMTSTANVAGLSITNTGTCTTEDADYNYITSNFSHIEDSEPDIFSVSAPGLSCQLVYDKSAGKFKTIPYQDLIISYTQDVNNNITSFTIKNDQGITYSFSSYEFTTETIYTGVANYFKSTYTQYLHGITYNDAWFLTSLTDVSGNGIFLTYGNGVTRPSSNPVEFYLPGNVGDTTQTYEYTVLQKVTPKLLLTVKAYNIHDDVYPGSYYELSWSSSGTLASYISAISGFGISYSFNYSGMGYTPPGGTVYTREFLRSVSSGTCGSPINYTFSYAGENTTTNTTLLPDSSTTKQDYWGYYSTNATTRHLNPKIYVNPSDTSYQRYLVAASSTVNANYAYTLPGANRAVDPTVISYGSLTGITNAQGGTTTITYEPNAYYDVSAVATVMGGGIRVKQTTISDGVTGTNNIVKKYSYVAPNGYSSGKPTSLPQYAFTIPYSGSATGLPLWEDATVTSGYDLSKDDHTILYQYFKESQNGAGSISYQYYIPGTNWDKTGECFSCTTPDWIPTREYSARPTCVSYGPVVTNTYSYPFAPNTNYDFERGLLQKETAANDAGAKISEHDYTYQRTGTPSVITGLTYETNASTGTLTSMSYAKYNIYYNTGELTVSDTSKLYDTPGSSSFQKTISKYTYGSTYHKLAQTQSTNSDQSVVTNYVTYSKDYSIPTSQTNANINALYHMQQLNINAPVESYTTVKRGATTLTTKATLTAFNTFIIPYLDTLYRPAQKAQFFASDGSSAFTPLTISGNTYTAYSGYIPVANYTTYDYGGFPQTSNDNFKHVQTMIYAHNYRKPVAAFSNAASSEVLFIDFDSEIVTPNTISISGTPATVTDRNGNTAINMTTSNSFSSTLTKNTQAKNYVLSAWINSTSVGHLTVTLTPTGGSALPSVTLPDTITNGWRYFEWKVPVTGVTTTTFAISFTPNATTGIDDILFYPENAETNTNAFNALTFYKICETNTNGISTYYEKDQWDRVLYTYDRDHNIIQKNTYVTSAEAAQGVGNGIITNSPATTNTNTTYTMYTTNPNSCVAANTTYIWNFGDGYIDTTATNISAPHLYTIPNTYTTSLSIISPLFGKIGSTGSVTVTAGPNINLSTTYFNAYNTITSVKFYQGSTLKYTFSGSPLFTSASNIPKGTYTVVITATGSQYSGTNLNGYGSVILTMDGSSSICWSFSTPQTYTFTSTNLSSCNNLNISLQQGDTDCGPY